MRFQQLHSMDLIGPSEYSLSMVSFRYVLLRSRSRLLFEFLWAGGGRQDEGIQDLRLTG